MTVDFAYQIVQFAANKKQYGFITPDEFNLIINQAQYSFLDYLLGEFQQYQVGRPVAKVQYSMTDEVRQRLTAFIPKLTTLTIDATGLSPYPTGYQQIDAMFDNNLNRIRFVPQHKLYSYLNSTIDPISTNPVFVIEQGGFRFYPNTTYNGVAVQAQCSYISTPPNIVYGYTLDVNGRTVYNPATSTDPLWYDVDMLEVIARALELVGVNLSQPELSGYARKIETVGQ